MIYKMGKNGIQQWEAHLEGSNLIVRHGQAGGKQQQELLPYDSLLEAEKELNRRLNKKIDREGYTYEVPDSPPPLPMLATTYVRQPLPPLIYVQPKLDGIRCIGSNQGMLSRRNEPINALPHITKALKELPDGISLDGELYCHGSSFQEHLSMIKRGLPTREGLNNVKYHVFDVVDPAHSFEDRIMRMEELVYLLPSYIVPVNTLFIAAENLTTKFEEMLADGYEGIIIRPGDGLYEVGVRSRKLLKLKKEYMEEFQILDITAATKGRERGAAIFICKTASNELFRVRPKMPLHERTSIFYNKQKFLGHWTRVTYGELTNKGIPSKPIAEGLASTKEGLQG